MATFIEKIEAVGVGKAPTPSQLTFLNDLSSEDRAGLRESWPTLPTERRRYIVNELTDMAENNIDLDFRYVFIIALDDKDPQIRVGAIEGLFEDESRLLLGRLLTMVRSDPSEQVRESAASALGRFTYLAQCSEKLGTQAEKLRSTLLEAANDESETPDVRRRVVESLGYFSSDPAIERLIAAAYEHGGKQSESALLAMGRSLDPRWAEVVLDELESGRAPMRYEAAHAAGEMMMAEALPFLVKMIDDRDTEVKLASIWALGQIGGKPATEALQRAMESKEPAIRDAANEALEEMTFNSDPLNVSR